MTPAPAPSRPTAAPRKAGWLERLYVYLKTMLVLTGLAVPIIVGAYFWPTIVRKWIEFQPVPDHGDAFGSMFDSAAAVFAALAFIVALYAVFSEREALDVSKEINAQVANTIDQQNALLAAQKDAQVGQAEALKSMAKAIQELRLGLETMMTASRATVDAATQAATTLRESQSTARSSMEALVSLSRSSGELLNRSIAGTTTAMEKTQSALAAQAQRTDVATRQLGLLVDRLAGDEELRAEVLKAQRAQFDTERAAVLSREFGDRLQRLQQSIYRFQFAPARDAKGPVPGRAAEPLPKPGIEAIVEAVQIFRESIETRVPAAEFNDASADERRILRQSELEELVQSGLVGSCLEHLVLQVAIHADWLCGLKNLPEREQRALRRELCATVPERLRLVIAYSLVWGGLDRAQKRAIARSTLVGDIAGQEHSFVEPSDGNILSHEKDALLADAA